MLPHTTFFLRENLHVATVQNRLHGAAPVRTTTHEGKKKYSTTAINTDHAGQGNAIFLCFGRTPRDSAHMWAEPEPAWIKEYYMETPELATHLWRFSLWRVPCSRFLFHAGKWYTQKINVDAREMTEIYQWMMLKNGDYAEFDDPMVVLSGRVNRLFWFLFPVPLPMRDLRLHTGYTFGSSEYFHDMFRKRIDPTIYCMTCVSWQTRRKRDAYLFATNRTWARTWCFMPNPVSTNRFGFYLQREL